MGTVSLDAWESLWTDTPGDTAQRGWISDGLDIRLVCAWGAGGLKAAPEQPTEEPGFKKAVSVL